MRTKGFYIIYTLAKPISEPGKYTLSFDCEVIKPPIGNRFFVIFGYKTTLETNGMIPYVEEEMHYKVVLDVKRISKGDGPSEAKSIYIYPNAGYYNPSTNPDCGEFILSNVKLERGTVATDWTPAPEDLQAEIDAINANPPRITAGGTWEVYVPAEGKYIDTGRTSKGDNGKAPIVKDGNWWEYDPDKGDYTDTGVKATGTDGKDAVSVTLTRQGRFVTRYRLLNEQGVMLPKPEAIREVEGGVSGAVRVTLQVLKGSTDVTAKAQAGAAWYVNGTRIKVGGSTLDLRAVDYADGKDDEIKCEVDTTSADKW